MDLEKKQEKRLIVEKESAPEITQDDIKVGDSVLHEKYGKGVVVMKNDEITRVAFSIEFGIKLFTTGHQALKKIKSGN